MLRERLHILIALFLGIAVGAALFRCVQPDAEWDSLIGGAIGAFIAIGGAIYAADHGRTTHQRGYAKALLPAVENVAKAIVDFQGKGAEISNEDDQYLNNTAYKELKELIDLLRVEVVVLDNLSLDGTLLPVSVMAIQRGKSLLYRVLDKVEGKPGPVCAVQAVGESAQDAHRAFQDAIKALNEHS